MSVLSSERHLYDQSAYMFPDIYAAQQSFSRISTTPPDRKVLLTPSTVASHTTVNAMPAPLINSSTTSPTLISWVGLVYDSFDIALLFELAVKGYIPLCDRRPQEKEKPGIIKNGTIIVYDEEASGIKRWTDGLSWSPSRVLNKFLVYREVYKTDSAGRKQVARRGLMQPPFYEPIEPPPEPVHAVTDELRTLVGSLVGTYDFKDGGLVKRTATCVYGGRKYHMVSYFTLQGYKNLIRPSCHEKFRGVRPSQEVINGLRDGEKQNGNSPPQTRGGPYNQDVSAYALASFSQKVESFPMQTSSAGLASYGTPLSAPHSQPMMTDEYGNCYDTGHGPGSNQAYMYSSGHAYPGAYANTTHYR